MPAASHSESWRLRVIDVTGWVTFGLATSNLVAFLLNQRATGLPYSLLLFYIPLAVIDGVAAIARRLPIGVRGGMIIFTWGVVGFTSTLQLGFLSTPLVIDLVTVVVCGLFFGPRASIIAFGLSVATLLLSATLHVQRDTGCGMDEATQRRAFDPFFTTKERGAGTGLGLSTVQSVVERSGGWVGITSRPREGTTISLPSPRPLPATRPRRQINPPRSP